jgi:hypothetical protein
MTSLADVRSMILASTPDEWEVPIIGPTYLNRFGMVTTFEGDAHRPHHHVEQDEHMHRAAYRPDVSLGLAWGMRAGHEDDEHHFPWSDRFADRTVRLQFIDVLWNGMLIDRREVAHVDGHRGTLPHARPMVVDTGQHWPEAIGETTNPYDVQLARLTHVLAGGSLEEFESHFRRSGIVEIPDDAE